MHSPFIYDLVTKCFYDKKAHSHYTKIKAYRNSLLKNTETISITDFGSGSKVFDSNQRRIQQIVKTSGTPFKRAKLLYRLIHYFEPKNVLELGTSLGIGTHAMALAKSNTKVTSIEGCAEISKVAQNHLKAFQIENTTLKTGQFSDIIPTLLNCNWDLVFFDGHHDKEATLNYFNQLLPHVQNDSVFIFDDIHWSKGMEEAWEIIKNNPQTRVTIDTFFWGFVFFRKEQVKENFTIRL